MPAAESYRASLRDGRRVFFAGRLVADVTAEPAFAAELAAAARGCEADGGGSADPVAADLPSPCSVDELRSMELALRHRDATANGTVLAVQTVLTATCRAAASAAASDRVRAWVNAVACRNARVAVARC